MKERKKGPGEQHSMSLENSSMAVLDSAVMCLQQKKSTALNSVIQDSLQELSSLLRYQLMIRDKGGCSKASHTSSPPPFK